MKTGDPGRTLPANFDSYLALFEKHGDSDREYLKRHYRRFLQTFSVFSRDWSPERGARLLDIGAHWLHQSVLYARAGYRVTAVELDSMVQRAEIRALAAEHGIELQVQGDLSSPDALRGLAGDSMDVILFCEVLEHLAFNPVDFWKEVYRVLSPGGRIVLTTPNYYFWKTRVRGLLRLLTVSGAGVSVDDVLGKPTYAHHWKEYSVRELRHYFRLLSPDFLVNRVSCLSGPLGRTIYAEIDLPVKSGGITTEPAW